MSVPAGEQEHTIAREGARAVAHESAAAVPGPTGLLSRVGNRAGLPRHLANDALRRRMLAAADSLAVLVAVLFAEMGELSLAASFWTVALLPVWIVLAKLHGLYDHDHRTLRHLTSDELSGILSWATVGTALAMAVVALTDPGSVGLGGAIRLWLALVVLTPALRGVSRVLWRAWTRPANVLLLGSGPLERATRRKLDLFSDIHLRVAGSIELESLGSRRGHSELAQAMRDASGGELPDRAIVCSHDVHEATLAEVVTCCRECRIKLSVVPPLRGAFGTAVRLSHVAELPFVEYHTGDASVSTLMLKRGADFVIAAAVLVLTAPVLAMAAIAIKLDSRGPVLYVQRRAGLGGSPFRMFKFRTMVEGAHERLAEVVHLDGLDDPMFKLRNDPRVTRVGRFLRRWSLDELPQLVNVMRGDMSLVGPRPEQVELVERYRPEHRFRLDARPGVTGPMQVFGRGNLDFDERLAVEREYIENVSLGRDARILVMTIPVVISGRGAF
ncbi:MAG TPA: sugar transferase [Thermoleophilaceae bacterium]|nr:sugar transferase [Thermoleophilaceae bacterium]